MSFIESHMEKFRKREQELDDKYGEDRNIPYIQFVVTKGMARAVNEWLSTSVYPVMIAKQKEQNKNPDAFVQACWEQGRPYEGAIGGGLTYEFTNTSIGTIVSARYSTYGTDYKLDLTDHSDFG